MPNELVRKVLQGDKNAYRSVVKECGPAVRAYLAGHLSDPDTVDDLAQETFVAAYENLAQFDPNAADLGWWIRGIARKKLLMHLRRVYQHGKALDQLKVEALRPVVESLPHEGSSAIDRLRDCIEKLPQRLMAVVKARYYARERVNAIATRLNTSVTAVSSLLFRGRKELETCMERAK